MAWHSRAYARSKPPLDQADPFIDNERYKLLGNSMFPRVASRVVLVESAAAMVCDQLSTMVYASYDCSSALCDFVIIH